MPASTLTHRTVWSKTALKNAVNDHAGRLDGFHQLIFGAGNFDATGAEQIAINILDSAAGAADWPAPSDGIIGLQAGDVISDIKVKIYSAVNLTNVSLNFQESTIGSLAPIPLANVTASGVDVQTVATPLTVNADAETYGLQAYVECDAAGAGNVKAWISFTLTRAG